MTLEEEFEYLKKLADSDGLTIADYLKQQAQKTYKKKLH